jgi:hypothetical protein
MSEYIITREQVEELNRAHGGMRIVTSWLSCYVIWDTTNTYPVMKSEHIAVDLPEIVRCRDCKHYDPNDEPSEVYPDRYWCDKLTVYMPPEGFCSFGERREP